MALRIKRLIDVALALYGLIYLSPLLAAISAAIRWRMGSPVLFRQTRPCHRGQPCTLVKFRTMREAYGPDGRRLPDAARIEPLGRLLRALSLDELPQLWNVLKGDLSLVGPRPLLMDYLPRYTAEQARRHDMKPGRTGLAQVNGRNSIDWDEKFAYDLWYVDHWSLALDARILARTVVKVLRREGIDQSEEAPMSEFLGSADQC
jgi:lipopolysaccharide/colanic/teichoic acid biosynthesis glycosyltransferase